MQTANANAKFVEGRTKTLTINPRIAKHTNLRSVVPRNYGKPLCATKWMLTFGTSMTASWDCA
jgi:hypothetical protein